MTHAADGGLHIADLGSCRLDSGEIVEECRIGFRTFGTLDAAKSNVVLFPTWFAGTSKPLVDVVPDRIVYTKRFFLVLVDALGNGAPVAARVRRGGVLGSAWPLLTRSLSW